MNVGLINPNAPSANPSAVVSDPYNRIPPAGYQMPAPGSALAGDPFSAGLMGGYPAPNSTYAGKSSPMICFAGQRWVLTHVRSVPGNPYPLARGNSNLANRYTPTPQAIQQFTLQQLAQNAMSNNPQNTQLGLGPRPASTGAPMPGALRANPVTLPPGLLPTIGPQGLPGARMPPGGTTSPAPPNGLATTTTTTPAALFARLQSSNSSVPGLPPGANPTMGPAGTYSPSGELIAMIGMGALGLPNENTGT